MKAILRRRQTWLLVLCFLNLIFVIEGGVFPALVRLKMQALVIPETAATAISVETNGLCSLELLFQSLTLYFMPIVTVLAGYLLRDQFQQFLLVAGAGLLSYVIGAAALIPVLCAGFYPVSVHLYALLGFVATAIVAAVGALVLWRREHSH